MDYLKEYYKIIDYRIEYKIEIGLNTEQHHITPNGFFDNGTPKFIINREDNLVYLTSEEHFLVHYYLKEYYKELKETKHKDYNKKYYIVSLKGFNAMGLEKTTRKDLFNNSKLYEQGRQELLEYYKEENISHIKEICEYYINNGKIPSNIVNSFLNTKLYKLISLKKSNDYKFYNEYLEVAKEYGVPELFVTKEEKMIKNINLICDFIDNNGYFPSHSSKNNKEKGIGSILKTLRYNKKRNIHQNELYISIIIERGYPDLFESGTYSRMDRSNENNITEKLGLKNINLICDFIDENGHVPIKEYDKILNRSLSHYRTLYTNNKTWFKSYEELSEERGYPDLFKFNSYRKNFNEETFIKIIKICDFIDENGYSPSNKSKDDYEKSLSQVIGYYRTKNKNNKKIPNLYIEKINKRGYPDLFESGSYPKKKKKLS